MHRFIALGLVAFGIAGLSSVAMGKEGELFASLLPTAAIDGRVVKLEDVAAITAREPSELAKCRLIEVARPVSLGKPVRLTREEIVRRIDAEHPECARRLSWGGSSEVVVSGKPQRADLQAATDAAAAFLMEKLGGGDFVSLRLVEGPSAVDVPAGVVRSRADTQAARKSGAYVDVPVVVEVDGVAAARPVLRFSVNRTQRPVEAVQTKTVESAPAAEPLAMADSGTGPYAVTRQQPVTLLIEDEGLRIESEGIALANAREGEKVRVRRKSGSVELPGRVVAQGVVLVEEN